MRTNQINKLKLLITGAFVAFTSLVSAQTTYNPYALFESTSSTSASICTGDSAKMTVLSLNNFGVNNFKWYYNESGQSPVLVGTALTKYASKLGSYTVKEYTPADVYISQVTLYPSFESNTIVLSTTATTRNQIISQGSESNLNQSSAVSSTTNTTTQAGAPWGFYTTSKAVNQMLITKSELEALGFSKGSAIQGISFDVKTLGDYSTGQNYLRDFKVKMGESSSES